MGFEPASTLLGRPRSGVGRRCDLRIRRACRDRSRPPRSADSRCGTDPARTSLELAAIVGRSRAGQTCPERTPASLAGLRRNGSGPTVSRFSRLPHPSEVMRSRTAAPTCPGGTNLLRTWVGTASGSCTMARKDARPRRRCGPGPKRSDGTRLRSCRSEAST